MSAVREISIELRFEKHVDGRYYIRSYDLPGFRLAGTDIDAMQRDLDQVVTDLLLHNAGFMVESLRWVPSMDDVKAHLNRPGPEGKATYVARGKIAA